MLLHAYSYFTILGVESQKLTLIRGAEGADRGADTRAAERADSGTEGRGAEGRYCTLFAIFSTLIYII